MGVIFNDEQVYAEIILEIKKRPELAIAEHCATKVQLKPRRLAFVPNHSTDAKLLFLATQLPALPELSDDAHAHAPCGVGHSHNQRGRITHEQDSEQAQRRPHHLCRGVPLGAFQARRHGEVISNSYLSLCVGSWNLTGS